MNKIKVAAASPRMILGDVKSNAREIINIIKQANRKNVKYLVFPELCICGCTLGTLMGHPLLIKEALGAVSKICEETQNTSVCAVIGLPHIQGNKLYSSAIVISSGAVCAVSMSPSGYAPFGFAPHGISHDISSTKVLSADENLVIRFGNQLFEDIKETDEKRVIVMPSSLNATASSDIEIRKALCNYSAKTGSAIIYASPNKNESTSFNVFDSSCYIAANGKVLASGEFLAEENYISCEIDLDELSISQVDEIEENPFKTYLSDNEAEAREETRRILELQSEALMKRLYHIHGKGFIIGVSGGLDSALALLASVRAADRMNIDRKQVVGISMPGFGTSSRTKNNSQLLLESLGCTYREISVKDACLQHFKDINHDISDHSVVFENAQARERTQILLDLANKEGLLDVGTGDLSESVLGFTTFGGDNLALYGINASIPKTVIRKVVFEAKNIFPEASDVLQDILDTPVSPELLPTDGKEITQKTESIVGSYDLHDFFIYHMIVNKKSPLELYNMALEHFNCPEEEIYETLGTFLKRFFAQQFKRNSGTECPNILVSVAPSAFNMPSDLLSGIWLKEYEDIDK